MFETEGDSMKKASQKKAQSKGLKLNKRTVKDLKPNKDVRGGKPIVGLSIKTCAGTPPEQCAASAG